jgi:hypothetical protein
MPWLGFGNIKMTARSQSVMTINASAATVMMTLRSWSVSRCFSRIFRHNSFQSSVVF